MNATSEPSHPAGETPGIDHHALDELASIIGKAGVAELIDIFLKDLTLQCETLVTAFEAADLQQISRVMHALKPGSSYVGGRQFSELCSIMEQLSRSNEVAAVRNLKGQFDQLRMRLEADLSKIRAHYPA